MEIGHKIFSRVILSLQLIQEGHFTVSGKRMYTIPHLSRSILVIYRMENIADRDQIAPLGRV